MKAGRKPKGTALKVFQGNPGKRRYPANEPKPEEIDLVPEPPEWLDEPGKEFWRDYAPKLARIGVLTEVDIASFTAAAQAYADFVICSRLLQGGKQVIKTEAGNWIQHPMVSIRNKADERMNRWLSQFGMSPSSRVSVNGKPAVADPIEARLDAAKKKRMG